MRLFVLTSDQYLHCLAPFAHLFNRFWGDTQEAIFVGFQRPRFDLPRNIRFWSLGKQEEFTWSQQVLGLCRMISDEVFGLFLEDYFLDKPVNTDVVYRLFHTMREQPHIVKIDLTDDRLKVPYSPYPAIEGVELVRSEDDAPFQTSLQAALWRKDFLYTYLKDTENPWQFEKAGTKRVVKARQDGKLPGDILGCKLPPVHYVNAIGGEGNMPGTWAYKRFPGWLVKELQNKGFMPNSTGV